MDTDYNLQELYERVGRNIAYLRKCKKLTQEEFAYHLNIHSQALVSQYEHAKKSLTLERIIEFCSFFEVPLEDMLFRDFLYIEQIKLSNNEVKTTTPIQKCAGNTYYGYYLKEQNKGCSEFSSQIACFEMDVLHSTLSHEALEDDGAVYQSSPCLSRENDPAPQLPTKICSCHSTAVL